MATEVDDNDYMSTDDDEYGYLSDFFSTDADDDDDLESLIHFDLLKVPAEDYVDLPPEERVRWMTIHFILQKKAHLVTPRRGQESKVEEHVSKEVEQVSKEEEQEVSKEQVSKEEQEVSIVVEEDDGGVEESKVPKTNDNDGGSGPRGTSWKRSSKPIRVR